MARDKTPGKRGERARRRPAPGDEADFEDRGWRASGPDPYEPEYRADFAGDESGWRGGADDEGFRFDRYTDYPERGGYEYRNGGYAPGQQRYRDTWHDRTTGRDWGRQGYNRTGYGDDDYGQGGVRYGGGFSADRLAEGGLGDWSSDRPEPGAPDHTGRGPRNYRRPDSRILDELHERMTRDRWLDASDIELLVDDGEVTLSGFVASKRDKRRAEDISDSVHGVGHVQNNLQVRDWRTAHNPSGEHHHGGGSKAGGSGGGKSGGE